MRSTSLRFGGRVWLCGACCVVLTVSLTCLADVAFAVVPGTNPATRPTAVPLANLEAEAMRQSLTYLASDELEGRGLETEGLNEAAAYIAGSFHASGLKPLAGMDDYFYRFDLTTADSLSTDTTFASNGTPYKLSNDFTALSFSAEKEFAAPAVFVGYGITNPQKQYDDYAGVDVTGKVVVAWRFEPADSNGHSKFTGNDWSDFAHLDTKAKNAVAHGAVALILTNPPNYRGVDPLLPFAKQFQGSTAKIPVLQLLRPYADELIKTGTGEDPRSLQVALDEKLAIQSRELKDISLSGKVAVKRTVRHLKNVVGYLPGTGPHADEYVIVGAHYDHLGHGGVGSLSPKSHDIHNGADDNGSGTAAVLELAELFGVGREHAVLLPRSVVFIAFTAEETGLIGSAHFVENPPVPLDKVVAMLNLDMVGRVRNETLFVGGGGTAPSFEAILNKATEGSKLKFKDIGKGGRGPSDHMSFAMKKIPVLFFFSGLHEDYHRPTDKVAKINFDGMAEVVDVSVKVIHSLTEMPHEAYVTASDAHSMSVGMGDSGGGHGRRVLLGVVPDYTGGATGADTQGVRISGTSPGTPAEKAGLKDGDVLIGYGDKKLETLEDLTAALGSSKPGDTVKLRIIRNKKELSLDVELGERK